MVAHIERADVQTALSGHEIIGGQHAGAILNDGGKALLHERDIERINGFIVLLTARQRRRLRGAEVEIVHGDDRRLQANLQQIFLQQMRRCRLAA